MRYIEPGSPAQPLPPAQPNSYLAPTAVAQQIAQPPTPPIRPSPPPPAHDHEPHRTTLLTEWRAHHGSDWVRADKLNPTVRRMIDARERLPAVRQKLRQFINTQLDGFTLESKTEGNAARPVTFYRMVGSEAAGLEG